MAKYLVEHITGNQSHFWRVFLYIWVKIQNLFKNSLLRQLCVKIRDFQNQRALKNASGAHLCIVFNFLAYFFRYWGLKSSQKIQKHPKLYRYWKNKNISKILMRWKWLYLHDGSNSRHKKSWRNMLMAQLITCSSRFWTWWW